MSLTAELQDPRRQALLEQIRRKHGREVGYKTTLLLWFADIERLEHFATDAVSHNLFAILVGFTMDIFNSYSIYYRQTTLNTASERRFSQSSGVELPLESITAAQLARSKAARRDYAMAIIVRLRAAGGHPSKLVKSFLAG